MNYKVGDKFEIEIEEVYESACPWVNAINLYRIKGFNSLVFDNNGLDKLKKIKVFPPKPKMVKASELAVDTHVICFDEGDNHVIRYFAGVLNGKLYAFENETMSKDNKGLVPWGYMMLEDGTIVIAE